MRTKRAIRCKGCGLTAADWFESDGINWTIRLREYEEGWYCQRCDPGDLTPVVKPGKESANFFD